ncbi:DUF2231 domain-containing protein [Woeseia oceani]|uniref:DUF2231 domain-containing protein n=1 Tax=Woeseia oceani TaxID=1548547 RepID=A0A193LH85_9GAMM|nr:DUF2231 domain-containing protein [Woeseia oceani]ANO51872.1 hypothetical protein BA177_12275 [Woeseia oceani]
MSEGETEPKPPVRLRLHAALVHFPVSAWTAAALLELTETFRDGPELAGINTAAAIYVLVWLGLAIATIALLAGMLEYSQLPEEPAVMATANRHMLLMGSTFLCFLIVGLTQPGASVIDTPPGLRTGITVLGLLLMVVGAHVGGRLVVLRQEEW